MIDKRRKQRARDLAAKGLSCADIARALRITRQSAHYLLWGRVRRRKNGTVYVVRGVLG